MKHLKGLDFPAGKNDIVSYAQHVEDPDTDDVLLFETPQKYSSTDYQSVIFAHLNSKNNQIIIISLSTSLDYFVMGKSTLSLAIIYLPHTFIKTEFNAEYEACKYLVPYKLLDCKNKKHYFLNTV